MKTSFFISMLLLLSLIDTCSTNEKKPPVDIKTQQAVVTPTQDSIALSFVFLGCNRVDRKQKNDLNATDTSTANLSALKRIWSEVATLKRKPDLFFFLGDMVLGESNTYNLDKQLEAWKALYYDTSFSPISTSGIETVGLPGNHEMLYYNNKGKNELPLKGATEKWMNSMREFMPKDRAYVSGKDSIINQMTFAFTRKNVGFVLMNTDTYNDANKEGQTATKWITDKIIEYKENSAIEHIFVLGHRPYYINNIPTIGHSGLPDGQTIWNSLTDNKAVAMLSAHKHDYQRMQPNGNGPYQIIAGNAGSKLDRGALPFFGYSKIEIMNSGKIKLTTMGYDIINHTYYKPFPNNSTTTRDQTFLTWKENLNKYPPK